MNECVKLSNCAFFKLVNRNEKIIDVLDEYVKIYCCGPLQEKCQRLKYFKDYGVFPGESISPSGLDFIKYITE